MTRVVTDLDERARLKHQRGRKPADLVVDEKHPQGRDAVWAAIRKLRTFSKLDLEAETRAPLGTLQTYLRGLTLAGYLSRSDSARLTPATWTLVRDVGVEAPRVTRDGKTVTQGDASQRMWQTMRIVKQFTLAELVAVAQVDYLAARSYVRLLLRARYLRSTIEAVPRRGRQAQYRLVPALDTGPRAPMIQRIRQVWDPNLQRVMWPQEGANG